MVTHSAPSWLRLCSPPNVPCLVCMLRWLESLRPARTWYLLLGLDSGPCHWPPGAHTHTHVLQIVTATTVPSRHLPHSLNGHRQCCVRFNVSSFWSCFMFAGHKTQVNQSEAMWIEANGIDQANTPRIECWLCVLLQLQQQTAVQEA